MGYLDFNYADDLDKRISISRCVFTFVGAPIYWSYILQSTMVLSIVEAEYISLMEAIKEAIWLKGLLDDLRVEQVY